MSKSTALVMLGWSVHLTKLFFLGDLVYKLKKIVGSNNFLAQFSKQFPIIKRLAMT